MENQIQYGHHSQEEEIETLSQEQQTSNFESTEFSFKWKIKRDYSSRIILDLKFSIQNIKLEQMQDYSFDEASKTNLDKNKLLQFYEELNTICKKTQDTFKKKINRINLEFKSDTLEKNEEITTKLNKFLGKLLNKIEYEDDLQVSIYSNFNWNGIIINQIAENARKLYITDIYSYFPLSNFKYPHLKKINIIQHTINNNLKDKYEIATAICIEKDFEKFICLQMLNQLSSIKIDAIQYPQLISVLIQNLLNTQKPQLKKIGLSLQLDPSQFQLILSLSNLQEIYSDIKICLNYNLDFGLLNLNSLSKCDFGQVNQNNEGKIIQQLAPFPYFFTGVLHTFQNKHINLIFKNLKSQQQLELFDQIRSFSDQILKNDQKMYLQYLKMNKYSMTDFSASISSCMFNKHNKPSQSYTDQKCSSSHLIPLNNNNNDDQNHNLKLSQSFVSSFIKTFIFKTSSNKLHNIIDNQIEKKKYLSQTLIDQNIQSQDDKKIVQNKQQLKLNKDNEGEDSKQNTDVNIQNSQKLQIPSIQCFSAQPLSLFVNKQNDQFQKRLSENLDFQKAKQTISNKNQSLHQNILSTYFFNFQPMKVISIELMFENTVFGINYKEIFNFISKCIHLKKLTLLNLCIEEDVRNSQKNDNTNNDQRLQPDTQKALKIYSSIFQPQSNKTNDKIIPDFIQSLRKTNLITFRFSTNIQFSFSSAIRFLQTQENMIHFKLRDFSTSQQQDQNDIESSNQLRKQGEQQKSLNKQIVDAICQVIEMNPKILSYNFKNTEKNCLQSKREFQQIIEQYLNLKRIIIYQIYASKYILHSEIIKRKEIFNYLITKFFIKTAQMQTNLNKIFSSAHM